MRQNNLSAGSVAVYMFGTVPVIWLALLIAPYIDDGIPGVIRNFGSIMDRPAEIIWCEDSLVTVIVLLAAYVLILGIALSSKRNYRKREEHGSARWANARNINRRYADRKKTNNKILTKKVAIGLDGRKHRRNLNVLVCGGSGSGKTRFYAKPNILNANTSFIVLDPKGTLYGILNAENHA